MVLESYRTSVLAHRGLIGWGERLIYLGFIGWFGAIAITTLVAG